MKRRGQKEKIEEKKKEIEESKREIRETDGEKDERRKKNRKN